MTTSRTRAIALVTACAAASALTVGGVSIAATSSTPHIVKIGGVKISSTPLPRALLPLGSNGKFPPSVIPTRMAPGQTITGMAGGSFTSTKGNPNATTKDSTGKVTPAPSRGDTSGAVGSFPIGLPHDLDPSDAGIVGGDNEIAECDGTPEQPTAPPGVLCVYIDFGSQVNVFTGATGDGTIVTGEGNSAASIVPINTGRHGFLLNWTAAAPGLSTLTTIWAYTAPDPNAKPIDGSPVGSGQ